MNPLVVIPSYLREWSDHELLYRCLESIHVTAHGEVDVLVVDDGSPNRLLVESIVDLWRSEVEFICKPDNEGFSRTVNVGLDRALRDERDAILVNADIEFLEPGWVRVMEGQQGMVHPDRPAAVVGALLTFPNGLIQHAGIYFSLLTRTFDHLHKYGPGNLPEALEPAVRPVTGALQFIRHECLAEVGVYDPAFRMGWEDVDYCIRVFNSDRECIYQPAVHAMHHESVFRGRPNERIAKWQHESFLRLMDKIAEQNLAGLVPTI